MAQTCSVSVTSVDQSLVQEILQHGREGGITEGSKGVRNQRQKVERREERAWERENVNERTGIKITNLPHIRGSPDVTGTKKRNGIREEGNEGDIRFGDAAFWVNELN